MSEGEAVNIKKSQNAVHHQSLLRLFLFHASGTAIDITSSSRTRGSAMQQQTTTIAHNAVPPPPPTAVARSSRISVHSHIKGLGLNQDGYATSDAAGFIGQTNAREVRFIPSYPAQSPTPPPRLAVSW